MRRPLDWIVVSISLLVLFANLKLTASDPLPRTVTTDDTYDSPFAYVRQDGSQLVVPADGSGPLRPAPPPRLTPGAPRSLDAVYTWSSPVMTPAISASPSWR
jgi:hypothetical protein